MRVFGSSGLLDILCNRLYVRTIPLSGCMDRRSHYTGSKFDQAGDWSEVHTE